MGLRALILVTACCVLWANAAVNPHHKPRPHKSRAPKVTPQPDCNPDDCGLFAGTPDCACASVENPLQDDADIMPQFVVLSFDGAISVENYDFYIQLQNKYANPNDCPIELTFFTSHKYNDYAMMNELHRRGNEIAAFSVSNVPDVEGYWRPANYSTWFHEINDVKQMMTKYGLIPEEDIKGWRTPFLEVGSDTMFQALVDAGFKYDSSISTYRYTNWYTNPGEGAPRGALYPFTMDYNSTLECSAGTCPGGDYPGFWVTPIIDLNDPRPMNEGKEVPNLKAQCNMLDSCVEYNTTDTEWDCPEDRCKNNLVNWLKDSFKIHYDDNRAPFGLYLHYAWIQMDDQLKSRHKDAYLEFLDWLVTMEDVYFVTPSTLIDYMNDAQYAEDMAEWNGVSCSAPLPTNCPDPITCKYENNLPFGGTSVQMTICTRPCPKNYPWLGDIDGVREV